MCNRPLKPKCPVPITSMIRPEDQASNKRCLRKFGWSKLGAIIDNGMMRMRIRFRAGDVESKVGSSSIPSPADSLTGYRSSSSETLDAVFSSKSPERAHSLPRQNLPQNVIHWVGSLDYTPSPMSQTKWPEKHDNDSMSSCLHLACTLPKFLQELLVLLVNSIFVTNLDYSLHYWNFARRSPSAHLETSCWEMQFLSSEIQAALPMEALALALSRPTREVQPFRCARCAQHCDPLALAFWWVPNGRKRMVSL